MSRTFHTRDGRSFMIVHDGSRIEKLRTQENRGSRGSDKREPKGSIMARNEETRKLYALGILTQKDVRERVKKKYEDTA